MKISAVTVLLLVLILGGSYALVRWAFDTDVKIAEQTCSSLNAKPHYTYRTRYICVTSDGRIVG